LVSKNKKKRIPLNTSLLKWFNIMINYSGKYAMSKTKKKEKVTPKKKKAEVTPKKKEKVTPKKKEELAPKREVLMLKKKAELTCSVALCGEKAKRSFSSQSVEAAVRKAGLQIGGNPKRIQLCDKHYRAIKKELKREKKTDRMRQGLPF
jgi:hypothetical protein